MNRASSWLIGFMLGIACAAAWFIAHEVWGWAWGWQIGAALVLGVLGVVLALDWLAASAVIFRADWFRAAIVATDDDAPVAVAAPAPAAVVAGVLLTDWERHHVEGLLLVVRHAEAAQSFTSTALVGTAFRDNEHWQYWLDICAGSGLVVKSNGVPTVLAIGKTYAWAKRQIIKATDIDFPAQYLDTPYPPLPYPFSDGLVYKGKLGKVEKAG